ncbi:hypothetical protein [Poseidonibacter sp.]|uniref:hypothetical protein n=1 Tax=Poseidonibacter sp. TaxID=2321188 RepID=UPI003C71423C
MFNKESLYINAIKYDTQLKLDYKKLSDDNILESNNSVFLVNDEILSHDIAHKINSSQKLTPVTYLSTLLISDTTRLVPKAKSSQLKDCEIAELNSEYDIAVLKTTLFETKNYFEKTGIDFIYSSFHILQHHLEQNVCRNELLIFLFNDKAFIVIVNNTSSIVYSKTIDLPTFESIKKTHFYENDVVGQKLFDEIYYLELNKIINNTLNEFYEKESKTFVEKITILYVSKQLTKEQIDSLSDEFLLSIEYHAINIDEEIFELSKDKHLKKSFVKPRKKSSSNFIFNSIILIFFIAAFFGIYKLYINIDEKPSTKIEKTISENIIKLPNHIMINSIIKKRVESIFNSIPYDVIIKELKLDEDNLMLKGTFLRQDTFIKSVQPELEKLYSSNVLINENKDKKYIFDAIIKSEDEIEIDNITYNKFTGKYIVDEFLPISRVSEQLKILLPQKETIVKFKSSNNNDITKYNYLISMLVQTPKEFFEIFEVLNRELYSINIAYPINMTKTQAGIEVEFNLVFNQPK